MMPTASHVNSGAVAAAERQCESFSRFWVFCAFLPFFVLRLKGTITFIWGLSPCTENNAII